jgi:hypothetical protein
MTRLHPVVLVFGLLTMLPGAVVLFALMPAVCIVLFAGGLAALGLRSLIAMNSAGEEDDGQDDD